MDWYEQTLYLDQTTAINKQFDLDLHKNAAEDKVHLMSHDCFVHL